MNLKDLYVYIIHLLNSRNSRKDAFIKRGIGLVKCEWWGQRSTVDHHFPFIPTKGVYLLWWSLYIFAIHPKCWEWSSIFKEKVVHNGWMIHLSKEPMGEWQKCHPHPQVPMPSPSANAVLLITILHTNIRWLELGTCSIESLRMGVLLLLFFPFLLYGAVSVI